jgi:formylglycine-generating enzyme required for sulfatase activity/serine/threonine protein kinase
MRCPQCGHENTDEARYCARCGGGLHEQTPAAEHLRRGQAVNGGLYRVLRPLGRGGMGTVYLAENTQAFGRLCVIKEMLAYYETGEEAKASARWNQEIKTLASLKHPGIPDFYGYFDELGHRFFVMEYVEGDNLESTLTREEAGGERVAGQLLPVDEVLRYGVEICRVLEYLANPPRDGSATGPLRGPVVHCDIKPANIIIDKNSGQAVLVDFGTAKSRYQQPEGAAPPDGDRPSVYGTVGYAAPEMYKGQAESRSDVFSLAATLYHLLTDDDPRDHPFKWPQLERLVPPLRLILQAALVSDPAQRLEAEQFRRQLESYRASQQGTLQPLTFPEGNLATTLTGVLDLSLRYWGYGRQILYDGSLDAWLRNSLHDPVTANRASEAVTAFPDAPDAGLDAFVRALNPRLPEPQLSLSASVVDLGAVGPGQATSAALALRNDGPGGSRGSVTSADPWLKVSPESYAVAPQQNCRLTLRVLAAEDLPPRQSLATRVIITADTGQILEAEVRLQTLARSATRPANGASARPVAARPATRPTVAPSAVPAARPPAVPAQAARVGSPWRGRILALAMFLLLAVAAVFAAKEWPALRPSELTVSLGLAALREGRWSDAPRLLAGLDSANRAQVREVALLLDGAMVKMPAGTLRMGREEGGSDERPVHDVAVAAIEVDMFEVTQVQYQRFLDENAGRRAPSGWPNGRFPAGQAMQPVRNITWEDARAYAAFVNKRLPSEAEWEWAARGPTPPGQEGRLYPWGSEARGEGANSRNILRKAVTVGSYPQGATPLGVMDMAGNVREWTADRYGPYRVPHAPPMQGTRIAVRGSSWDTYDDTASARGWAEATEARDDLGFRCVR